MPDLSGGIPCEPNAREDTLTEFAHKNLGALREIKKTRLAELKNMSKEIKARLIGIDGLTEKAAENEKPVEPRNVSEVLQQTRTAINEINISLDELHDILMSLVNKV